MSEPWNWHEYFMYIFCSLGSYLQTLFLRFFEISIGLGCRVENVCYSTLLSPLAIVLGGHCLAKKYLLVPENVNQSLFTSWVKLWSLKVTFFFLMILQNALFSSHIDDFLFPIFSDFQISLDISSIFIEYLDLFCFLVYSAHEVGL